MKTGALILILSLADSVALSQIVKGTMGAVYFTKEKIVMAVDSRAIVTGERPNDNQCKVAALDNRMIFASAGFAEYRRTDFMDAVSPWDNTAVARQAFRLTDSEMQESIAEGVARRWASLIAGYIGALYAIKPQVVIDAAENGVLTTALFGEVTKSGWLVLYMVRVTVDSNRLPAVDFETPKQLSPETCPPCALGKGVILLEFVELRSARARNEARNWRRQSTQLSPRDRDVFRMIRLVELTIAFDKSGTVGGAVDALELRPGYGIRWIRRKQNCPEK